VALVVATCSVNNVVLSFDGTNNFIGQATLFLASMETASSLAAQQTKMVVHQTTVYLASVELPTLSITTSSVTSSAILTTMEVVAQSMHQTILHFSSVNWTSNFINNSVNGGKSICAVLNITLTFNGTIYFINNWHDKGKMDTPNRDTYGGGMFMRLNSTLLS